MLDEQLQKSLDGIERALAAAAEKAEKQQQETGKVSVELKAELTKLGEKQLELAARLLTLEQSEGGEGDGEKVDKSWGAQVVASEGYKAFAAGQTSKMRIEVKNTLVGADAVVAPDRKPGTTPGPETALLIEDLYVHVPTTSGAIEFTKETAFTNNAAEVAEAAQKPESALTFALVNMPISTVAHWIKISRQLAADAPALAAYVNKRMIYGVNKRVDTQLVSGNGTPPNISGFMTSGNFTAHGYAAAGLGTPLAKLALIRLIIGDLQAAGYPPTAIVLNPVEWATIELELLRSTVNAALVNYNVKATPALFGVPVIPSVGMAADLVAVGAFNQHGTIYDRESVTVDMSESDSDNFTKNLITIRAERRLALASEVPAAIRAGDLTPA